NCHPGCCGGIGSDFGSAGGLTLPRGRSSVFMTICTASRSDFRSSSLPWCSTLSCSMYLSNCISVAPMCSSSSLARSCKSLRMSRIGHSLLATTPVGAIYDCKDCGRTLRLLPGSCCVFCSYGSVPCLPIQKSVKPCCTPLSTHVPFDGHDRHEGRP